MAERTASVRMAIGFMTSSSVEPPSSHERVADLPAGKESPAPRRSARMNGVYSSSTGHRSAAVPMMSSAASPRPTQQANDPAARRRNPRSPADPQAAGSRNNVWQAEQGVHIPQGEPTARQQEVVVGDRPTPATNRWVRFAWEPLAVEGGGREEQRRGRSSSTSAAGGFGGVAGDGVGDGRVPGTSGPTLPQGFSAGAARQGREKLGVKRFRPSPGDAFGEETEQAGSSFGGLVGAAPPDRTVWGLQTQAGEGSPRRRRCSTTPRRDAFEVTGAAAARQADRGAAPPDPGSSLSLAPRELVGAAGVVTPPPPGGHDHAPLLAADRRDERQRVTRGINTRSSGAWGRGGDVHAMAEEEAQVGGNGTGATAAAAAAAAAAATYQGATAYQQHHQEQGESYARGSSAKKPRYHRLHRTPSVGQMDTLTDGVGSLGVVSPRGTSDGGRREPTNAPRRRGFVSRRATLVGSTGDGNAFLPGPACPALSLGGVGRADQRAARARAGAQAQGCGMTRRSKAQSSATVGGPGQHQSKRRRNGSLAAGASSSFRNVVKPSVLPVDHDLAEASATLSAGAATAAAAATPRARRPSASRAGQADAVGGSDAQSSPNRRQRLAHLGSSGPPAAAAAAAANRDESEAEAGGCGAMDVEPTTEGQQERCCPCSSNSSSGGGGGGGGSSSSTMPPPSTPHLPRTSSSLARLMMQQGAGKRGAPGFDAAVTASAAEASSAAAAATGANGGKGGLAAVAEGGGGGGADLDEDDNSSDGGAAHEDLSAWLHSTDDWWTS